MHIRVVAWCPGRYVDGAAAGEEQAMPQERAAGLPISLQLDAGAGTGKARGPGQAQVRAATAPGSCTCSHLVTKERMGQVLTPGPEYGLNVNQGTGLLVPDGLLFCITGCGAQQG